MDKNNPNNSTISKTIELPRPIFNRVSLLRRYNAWKKGITYKPIDFPITILRSKLDSKPIKLINVPLTSLGPKLDSKPILISLGLNNLAETAYLILKNRLKLNNCYSVFVKIRYDNTNFVMTGDPLGFSFKNHDNLVNLTNTINIKLSETFVNSISKERVVMIYVIFRELNENVLDKFSVSSLIENLDVKISSRDFNIAVNYSYLGTKLSTKCEGGFITNINLEWDGKTKNFYESIAN